MIRALKKAKNMEEAKKASIEAIDKNIGEVEHQKEVLQLAIDLRLKQFATEKNALIEKANKEIDEFNTMYEKFESMCKSTNITTDKVWVHGRD